MEPRSIYLTCPEHGRGCVAVLQFVPGERSMNAPGWADQWRQRYPTLGLIAIEHVVADVPAAPVEEPAPVLSDDDLTPPRKRWWRR